MMVPTIHLNGTGKAGLLEGYLNVLAALRDAEAALCKAGPNGRDYYPQGAGAIYRAQDEHRARLVKLDEIKTEIEALALAVDEGGHKGGAK